MEKIKSQQPSLLSLALAWLDKMHIPYHDDGPPDFWAFEYKGFDFLLSQTCEHNEIGIFSIAFITPDGEALKDEQSRKLIFDFAKLYLNDNYPHEGDAMYISDGLCFVYNYWEVAEGHRIKLYKKQFVEMLESFLNFYILFKETLKRSERFLFESSGK